MALRLIKASEEYRSVLQNLMQFYIYDFSAYVSCDLDENALFPAYINLEEYWHSNRHFPYLIAKDEKYVGFVLVKLITSETKDHYSIAEFFVMKMHRRQGIGRSVAEQIFSRHKGEWEIHQRESNIPAREFWRSAISGFKNGMFIERFVDGRYFQHFNSGGPVTQQETVG